MITSVNISGGGNLTPSVSLVAVVSMKGGDN